MWQSKFLKIMCNKKYKTECYKIQPSNYKYSNIKIFFKKKTLTLKNIGINRK